MMTFQWTNDKYLMLKRHSEELRLVGFWVYYCIIVLIGYLLLFIIINVISYYYFLDIISECYHSLFLQTSRYINWKSPIKSKKLHWQNSICLKILLLTESNTFSSVLPKLSDRSVLEIDDIIYGNDGTVGTEGTSWF